MRGKRTRGGFLPSLGSAPGRPKPCADHREYRQPQSIGSVRVTTGGTTVRHFMSEAVVAFRQRYPKVSLEFQTETSGRRCFDALAAGNLDLAWVTLGSPVRGIEQRPVVDLPWVLAVRTADPLAHRARIEG